MFVIKNKIIKPVTLDTSGFVKSAVINTMVVKGTFFAIGGFRFILRDDSKYAPGTVTTNTLTSGIFINMKATATNTYTNANYYNVANMFDTSRSISGTYLICFYWLSSVASTITVTFNTPIDIKGYSCVPLPDNANNNRGISSFKITFNYVNSSYKSYSFVTPTIARNGIVTKIL